MLKFAFAVLALAGACNAIAPSSEAWSYVDVRDKAHMFWWLQRTEDWETKPLIMWLQGGPGGSSTGFGNFLEIGPYAVDGSARNSTWLNAASLLFVDNPVGTGYSYVDDDSAFTTNVDEIAADLMTLFKAFLAKESAFTKRPFYVFCESYGGKMTSVFAVALKKAIANGEIECDFKGVALGDSWIDGLDYTLSWAPFLRSTSLLDAHDEGRVMAVAKACEKACQAGQWVNATRLWGATEDIIDVTTDGVDFYNILLHHAPDPGSLRRRGSGAGASSLAKRVLGRMSNDPLDDLMNGPVKKKLGIPASVVWGAQSGKVFDTQNGDFMKPVVYAVDELLTHKDLSVTVYNGQLDLICATAGTEQWMTRLQWPQLSAFLSAHRTPVYVAGDPKGDTKAFVKSHDNLRMFYIMSAGHMVPADQPEMALKMVRMVLGQE